METNYSQEFLDLLHSVTAKRPKTVIDHILKYGFITTEDLKEKYGYNHPPRAVRDVKEYGIPIEMYRVEGSDGRKIAAYKFGTFSPEMLHRISGRTALSKKIKEELITIYGTKCFIYNEIMDENDLQIDHRVPFEVGGDFVAEQEPEYYMLLSPSANRLKSWACEKCMNWNNQKDKNICLTCYWAYPENYEHIAMVQIRRLDIIFKDDEVSVYDALKKQAANENKEIQEIVKKLIEKNMR
ncbi:hypothetical protein AGMMS49579_18680 [Spirochaetia bacterium]|nr:hypothetical protein AGMMS49579_18680 [Spirochaetia bacterium]